MRGNSTEWIVNKSANSDAVDMSRKIFKDLNHIQWLYSTLKPFFTSHYPNHYIMFNFVVFLKSKWIFFLVPLQKWDSHTFLLYPAQKKENCNHVNWKTLSFGSSPYFFLSFYYRSSLRHKNVWWLVNKWKCESPVKSSKYCNFYSCNASAWN